VKPTDAEHQRIFSEVGLPIVVFATRFCLPRLLPLGRERVFTSALSSRRLGVAVINLFKLPSWDRRTQRVRMQICSRNCSLIRHWGGNPALKEWRVRQSVDKSGSGTGGVLRSYCLLTLFYRSRAISICCAEQSFSNIEKRWCMAMN